MKSRLLKNASLIVASLLASAAFSPAVGKENPETPAEAATSTSPTPDPLDALLNRAGTSRSKIGFKPKGWWLYQPRSVRHKLDHVDDLFAEPLALVPFARTLAMSTRGFLAPHRVNGVWDERQYGLSPGGHSIFRLAHTAISLRYGGMHRHEWSPKLRPVSTNFGDAVAALTNQAKQPMKYYTLDAVNEVHSPGGILEESVRARIGSKLNGIPREVDDILGRLVDDVGKAQQQAELAFRNVSAEERQAVHQFTDGTEFSAILVTDGLNYSNVHVLDDVERDWDEGALWHASMQMVEAIDEARRRLQALPPGLLDKVPAFDWKTPYGWIRIRGTGSDTIDASDSLLIVDLGGDDKWQGPVGSTSATRLTGYALDLSGNDRYEGSTVTQGAGVAGIGILMDAAGNDQYAATNYAQGMGFLGFGALIDVQGTDVYVGRQVAQGSSPFCGIGLLADASGDDKYKLISDGQGFGGPGAVGYLADRIGNDEYYAEPSVAKGRPGYGPNEEGSLSQAQGFGIGRYFLVNPAEGYTWAGGIGVLTDTEGNDTYTAGSWAQATGYMYGTGILVDDSGNDRYRAGVYSMASSAHYGMGGLIDEAGDDIFHNNSTIAFAHDISVALFLNSAGNDDYTTTAIGSAITKSPIALFVDADGDDTYRVKGKKSTDKPLFGGAMYYPSMDVGPDGMIQLVKDDLYDAEKKNPRGIVGVQAPFFGWISSYGLFLDVKGTDSYPTDGPARNSTNWGDGPESDHWRGRSVGVGMDAGAGKIDWQPLSARPDE